MASVTQLLARHGRILVLDAASTVVQVGLLRAGAAPLWERSTRESGQALFAGADACLRAAGLTVAEVRAFVFCEGPGSMLGVRTAAMAIRTWQIESPAPAFRYQSLVLLAHHLQRLGTPAPFSVVADARRDTWHCVTVAGAGDLALPLRRVAASELAASTEPLYQPGSFRAWAPAPRPTLACDFDAAALLAALADRDLLLPADDPDAYQAEAPSYRKWTPQVHSSAILRP